MVGMKEENEEAGNTRKLKRGSSSDVNHKRTMT
jgi:hypothetical protein